MKEVVRLAGYSADERETWSIELPFITEDDVAAILGVPPAEFGGAMWPVTRAQLDAILKRFGHKLLNHSGAIDFFVETIIVEP